MITRDKIHEEIPMSAGWIHYSELMSTHECCSTTLSDIIDLHKPNPLQSWFISTSNIWPNVDGLNNLVNQNNDLVILEVKTCKVKHKNNRIQYELKTYEYKQNTFYLVTILITHYSLYNVLINQHNNWIKTTVMPCSKHAHNVCLWFLLCGIDQLKTFQWCSFHNSKSLWQM